MCVSALPTCMSVYHIHAWYLRKLEERVRPPWTGVRSKREQSCEWCFKSRFSERPMFLLLSQLSCPLFLSFLSKFSQFLLKKQKKKGKKREHFKLSPNYERHELNYTIFRTLPRATQGDRSLSIDTQLKSRNSEKPKGKQTTSENKSIGTPTGHISGAQWASFLNLLNLLSCTTHISRNKPISFIGNWWNQRNKEKHSRQFTLTIKYQTRRDGLLSCSCRGAVFSSQDSGWRGSQLACNSSSRSLTPPSGLWGHSHTCALTHIHIKNEITKKMPNQIAVCFFCFHKYKKYFPKVFYSKS